MTDETDETGTDAMSGEQAVLMAAAASNLVARQDFARRGGIRDQFGGDRDMWSALGYKEQFTYQNYKDWYERGDIAKAIIEKPPGTTWRERPELVDDAEVGDEEQTDFEKDVEKLFDATTNPADDDTALTRGLRHYFERVDTLGRIGRYSVLFLGLSDVDTAADLRDPVDTGALSGLDDLLYLTPLGEGDAQINTWVEDVTHPRNGLPETYTLDLANGDRSNSQVVHHSRVIHVAEGVLDNEIYGEPALRAVMNRLFDLQKIYGASAEAYWMVANPGLALSVDPDFADVPTDKMDEQVEEYEHNLRRVMKLFGTDVEQLEAQDVDPEPAADTILKAISGTIEIPQRKLVGSERGELASSQDEASYLDVISQRQTSYDEPVILRPFFDRLIKFGIVAPPQAGTYTVEWEDLFQLTALEEAELGKTQAEWVQALAPMGEVSELHSPEAIREHSPLEEPEDATPPDELDDVDDEIDEADEEVQEQFEEMMDWTRSAEADD